MVSVKRKAFVSFIWLAFTLGQVTTVQHCPPGWLAWNQSCYMMTSTPMLWTDVHQLCRSSGAHMAVPSSDAENQFMGQLYATLNTTKGRGLWIGCSDREAEGNWVCAEDEEEGMGYRNWAVTQPNNYPEIIQGNGADYARLQKSSFWADFDDQPEYAMCEMKSTVMQCCTNCYL